MSSLCNDQVKIAFFTKHPDDAAPANVDTISKIARGIKHGIERCHQRQSDVDMFVCLQGNTVIPNNLPIRLEEIDATMESSSNGDLRFKTLHGNHTLHVVFSGGGSQFRLRAADRPPAGAAVRPPSRQIPQPNQNQRRRAPVPSGQRNGCGMAHSRSSDESSEEDIAPLERPRCRHNRKSHRLLEDSSDSSSSAEEYQGFSQITGRQKRP
ncbi:hypothetical protein SEMRO_1222_G253750.1 [Seminavis robusta]|uniref:Uncharacterized protein n=1 Tax=Seminavis robusta TaxID=568900 RepID=A0A9N8ELW9_9STRA|nr:hypothetical protein SEMRO_1222_G253750.1 [Seminavis robusta]|eukprot:Sro1222_g253750.1 n/a (210) ;mRNA; f:1974-2603